MSNIMNIEFMQEAIRLSEENVENGGGPFGAVIVKDGKIIATGVNRVTEENDPTAHAEVKAIRACSKALNTFDLKDCDIYSSCEPCPMCLGAIYWAHIAHLYYGNTAEDAKEIGFDDSFIYDELAKDKHNRRLYSQQLLHTEALVAFKKWTDKSDKEEY